MTLVYIERVIDTKRVAILPRTWRLVTLGALILASKVWEDQSVWNVDFVRYYDLSSAALFTRLERSFLGLIEFNVCLKASLYLRYFIALQGFLGEDKGMAKSPTEKDTKMLELITVNKQKQMEKLKAYAAKKSSSDASLPALK